MRSALLRGVGCVYAVRCVVTDVSAQSVSLKMGPTVCMKRRYGPIMLRCVKSQQSANFFAWNVANIFFSGITIEWRKIWSNVATPGSLLTSDACSGVIARSACVQHRSAWSVDTTRTQQHLCFIAVTTTYYRYKDGSRVGVRSWTPVIDSTLWYIRWSRTSICLDCSADAILASVVLC